MDALDVAILRTMGIDPYGRPPQGPDALKPGAIARVLKVTPETVRERVQRMEQSGLIAGWQAHVNLRHLGLEGGSFLFDAGDEARRADAVPKLAPVEGLLAVHSFLGPEICVDLCYGSPAERQRRLQLLASLTGDPDPVGFLGMDMPEVKRPLTHLDWRIAAALRGRARRPLSEVAEDVGVGYRTVKRHYDRMCEEGSLFTVPMLDPGKEQGSIPFWLLLYLGPEAGPGTAEQLRRAFLDLQLMGMQPTNKRMGNVGLLLVAGSPGEVEDLRRQGSALPGVVRTSALVPCDLRDTSGWVDDLIAARIRATAPSAAAGP